MTTREIVLCVAAYAVAWAIAIHFTRATPRRVLGSLAGGLAASVVGFAIIAFAEREGWWQIPWATGLYFQSLLFVGLAITMAPVYLLTWRVARRFGARGLAVCIAFAAIIGPPRDYLYARVFPAWMTFAPGWAPVLADAAAYLGMLAVGHAAMRWLAGPAGEDRLTCGLRRP